MGRKTLQKNINDFNRALEQGQGVVYRRNYYPDTFEYIGDYIETITGYSAKELTPAIWRKLIIMTEHTGDLADFTLEEARQKFRSGEIESWQVELQVRTRAGGRRWIADMATVLRDDNGTCIGCIGVFQDVTKRKEAERNLHTIASQLRRRNEEMEEDLIMAREIQQALVTEQIDRFPINAENNQSLLNFHHRYIPATELAGDFYEIIPISEHRVGVFVCDVMGHGVRAALLTTFLRGLLEELIPQVESPGNLLSKMNRSFMGVFGHTENFIFATAVYLIVDTQANRILYSNAGHPDPVRLNPASGSIAALGLGEGLFEPALGIVEDFEFTTATHTPADEDVLLIFTDGLVEACVHPERMYGETRMQEFLEENIRLDPENFLNALIEDIHQFIGSSELDDDLCILAIAPSK